ncbi:MAG TPA: dihydrolipoyllysine-residue acetyltransferase [Ignavibacteriaceae bacterium]|jgi:pyruvate dehydrogenase E2 component (dihydrolipoamide acetyltransferase)|nr:MAG: Dihydrolipoyllysine-residue acetyltransferase component of pyruvate dehydrogenase complex [Ignavibacteria bacterium ADurb.Bin266]OQY74746.1 MAG: branched-chain alpha-keto acid dehydrogenase subunit E2 [Ignavibacteriales bacterium UTCHB2]HQF41792.1 dihydrolipoyllysine-residue acetyltransferase [Ignavibacteriaceae bacterium]HQI40464.1 dihydrolipoyllysine-residue acetyltransferase [Ignavibacteriaceae bacterium]HQJ46195.1 dihydrolipoyllysine-residue acetyltransferase [Ignavibacteriaceae bac
MTKEFKLPELGENIDSAEVVEVLVKVGDTITKDQAILEIETEKATIEVPSTVEGKIVKLNVKSGDKVKVGAIVLVVEEDGKATETDSKKEKVEIVSKTEAEKPKSTPQAAPKPAVDSKPTGKKEIKEFRLPELGENIDSANVVEVLVKVGDVIEKDQPLLEIETEKATIEVPSSLAGKVVEVLIKTGEKAKVGAVMIKVETSDQAPAETKSTERVEPTKEQTVKEEIKQETPEIKTGERPSIQTMEAPDKQPPILKGAAPAAPSVRRIAREIGVDINKVPGTGPGGRISMDDVKAYSKKLHESYAQGGGTGLNIKAETLPDFSKFGEIKKVEMTNIRKKTAEHLSYAWATIPHVTQFDKADITLLEKSRKELNKNSQSKLTVTAILVRIIVEALKKFPQFNSSIDMEKKEIIYKNYFNIGIAVDTELGLIVPVIKNADKKSLVEISVELNSLAEKARNKKIGLDDLQGGCFSISNLGGIGGTYFTPIVNSPEVAILGVSRGANEPVWNGFGVFEPRLMLPLSLSYDHRIIDGADAIRFLRFVVEALEQPLRLL